jgi:nitrite reductase (NADH) small subunit
MRLVRVGRVSELPPDTATEVLIDGNPYALCNAGGTIRALSGVCLHSGGPLGQGQIHDGRIVCPYHLWEFDCATGEYDFNPAMRVPTFEVKVEGDDILLQVP